MSRMEDLIEQLCPSGVPFYSLLDVSRTVPGLSGKTKTDFDGGNARYVSYKNVFANLAVDQSAQDFVRIGPAERQNQVRSGDVIITGSSESLDEVGLSSVVLTEPAESLYLNSFCFMVRFNDPQLMDPGFTKHLFRAESIRSQIRRTASGVTRINVSKPRFMKVRIPVPPLPVQREVADILDTFAVLEAVLEAELEARRRQYGFYRDHLLTSASEEPASRWSTLGKVSTRVSSGATPTAGMAEYYEGGAIPWLRTSEVVWRDIYDTEMRITTKALEDTAVRWIPANCVIVAISGATAARAAVNKIPLTTNQHCCNLEIDPEQADYRFVFHWVTANYFALEVAWARCTV